MTTPYCPTVGCGETPFCYPTSGLGCTPLCPPNAAAAAPYGGQTAAAYPQGGGQFPTMHCTPACLPITPNCMQHTGPVTVTEDNCKSLPPPRCPQPPPPPPPHSLSTPCCPFPSPPCIPTTPPHGGHPGQCLQLEPQFPVLLTPEFSTPQCFPATAHCITMHCTVPPQCFPTPQGHLLPTLLNCHITPICPVAHPTPFCPHPTPFCPLPTPFCPFPTMFCPIPTTGPECILTLVCLPPSLACHPGPLNTAYCPTAHC